MQGVAWGAGAEKHPCLRKAQPRGMETATETLCWRARDEGGAFQLGLVKDRSATASGTLMMGLEGWTDIPCRNQGPEAKNSVVPL